MMSHAEISEAYALRLLAEVAEWRAACANDANSTRTSAASDGSGVARPDGPQPQETVLESSVRIDVDFARAMTWPGRRGAPEL